MRLFVILQILLMASVVTPQSTPTCPRKCGNIGIPYPFGTEKGCYLNESYHVECNSMTLTPRLSQTSWTLNFTQTDRLEVLEIQSEGQLRVVVPAAYTCSHKQGHRLSGSIVAVNTSTFPFSTTRNRFTGVGCDTESQISLKTGVDVNCKPVCDQQLKDIKNGSCTGSGCCHADIPDKGETSAILVASTPSHHRDIWNYTNCSYAFIAEEDNYSFVSTDLTEKRISKYFSVVLDWSVGDTNCEEAQKDKATYLCQENSECFNGQDDGLSGYRCKCSKGYQGNPYIQNGCQDINECEDSEHKCFPGQCENTEGSYTCVCPEGYQQDGKTDPECITAQNSDDNGRIRSTDRNSTRTHVGISEGVAVAAVVAMIFMFWRVKKRRRIKVKEDFFKENGGIMLQKLLSTCEDPVNKAKIFTEEELKEATDNFNENNIVGRGGYGTVYRGTLANKMMVAIKKSNLIDQSQVKQFVNEVIILSQINHPNIVKLLGCCLETNVPLLVYEYITNNTLCHHLHTQASLTFNTRLKIAIETAEALAYMHSTTQIIHRDVKPSNILLNDDFTAKVSDFGISRYVPLGQTHLSTFVKGTIGYMDPEYFRTSKLTEKSDVYSFGVVLMELLTGAKLHSLEIPERVCRGAGAYFASLLEENSLVEVLDDEVKRDNYAQVVKCVAIIAINCLASEGKTRPTMTQVKEELKELRKIFSQVKA